jgi:hypothetical protein
MENPEYGRVLKPIKFKKFNFQNVRETALYHLQYVTFIKYCVFDHLQLFC